MKIIDLYIIKKFLGTFVYALSLIIVISIVFDVSENIGDFIDRDAPLSKIAFEYYLNFIPYFINLFSHLFTFITVIFFTSQLANNTEIIAILNSGISFKRLLRPYMISAAIICFGSLFLGNFLIPKSNQIRLNFEEIYIRNQFRYGEQNIHRQITPGTFIYMEHYDNIDRVGFKFSLEKYKEGKLTYRLSSDFIRWDSIKNKWNLENFVSRNVNGLNEKLITGNKKDTLFQMRPEDFTKRISNIETMDYFELDKFIEEEKIKGNDNIVFYEVEKYGRISRPFATFILTLIGVSVASRKVRGGIGMQIGFGLLLSFTYILFMQVTTTFATYSNFNVIIACWLPNIIFGLLSIFLLRSAPK